MTNQLAPLRLELHPLDAAEAMLMHFPDQDSITVESLVLVAQAYIRRGGYSKILVQEENPDRPRHWRTIARVQASISVEVFPPLTAGLHYAKYSKEMHPGCVSACTLDNCGS